MKKKKFLLRAKDIRPLLQTHMGCIATDRITVDGEKVGFCYREKTDGTHPDSGWRFFSGDENDAYLDDPDNSSVFALNTIANYDPDIIPLLDSPAGTAVFGIRRPAISYWMPSGWKNSLIEKPP